MFVLVSWGICQHLVYLVWVWTLWSVNALVDPNPMRMLEQVTLHEQIYPTFFSNKDFPFVTEAILYISGIGQLPILEQ